MGHGYPTLGDDEKPTAEEDVVYSDKREGPPDLRFLHYNDIYHPEYEMFPSAVNVKSALTSRSEQSEEPVGGAGRFQTLCNYYRDDEKFKDQPKLITVFSGDAYNPSTESAVTRGLLCPKYHLCYC